jgi:hypothetical protein
MKFSFMDIPTRLIWMMVLTFFVLTTRNSFSQNIDLRPYLSNVVDIGGGDFGYITAELDPQTVSFITIKSSESEFFDGIAVKFHQSEFEGTGLLIHKVRLGKYWLGIYQSKRPKDLVWREEHYNNFQSKVSTFATFLDNGISDNQWNTFRQSIDLTSFHEGIATLSMGEGPVYSRGMPVFNSQGSLTGFIAHQQLDEKHFTFEALDIGAIENILYRYAKCKYFQLIRFGYRADICTREDKYQQVLDRNDRRRIRRNKSYLFTMGPAFTYGAHLIPSKEAASVYAGFGYSAGINMVFNPDGRTRLIIKPRYTSHKVKVSDQIEKIVPEFDLMELRVNSLEVPILVDFLTRTNVNGNQALAIGYAPVYHSGTEYTFGYNGNSFMRNLFPESSLSHKFVLELTWETRLLKWGFIYSIQNNNWVSPDSILTFQGRAYNIRSGQYNFAHTLALEFSWRLWGNWLLKEH